VSGAGADYETVTLTLPQGDADAGREAFAALRCTACHQVTGETTLPSPVSQNPGPELGPALSERPAGALATAIVSPSHSMSIDTSPETRANVEGVLSPMADYSDTMTVRQLLDLVTFLGSR
jgi:mono/diheme cytochrome c family protein